MRQICRTFVVALGCNQDKAYMREEKASQS